MTLTAHALCPADRDFLAAFENGGFPLAEFNHRAHVRLAYACLADSGVEAALPRIREAIQGFLRHNGVDPGKYHETLTRAWLLAVWHFMQTTSSTSSADDLIERNPALLDKDIMLTHYSATLLFSPEARGGFVEPDLDPIPGHGP